MRRSRPTGTTRRTSSRGRSQPSGSTRSSGRGRPRASGTRPSAGGHSRRVSRGTVGGGTSARSSSAHRRVTSGARLDGGGRRQPSVGGRSRGGGTRPTGGHRRNPSGSSTQRQSGDQRRPAPSIGGGQPRAPSLSGGPRAPSLSGRIGSAMGFGGGIAPILGPSGSQQPAPSMPPQQPVQVQQRHTPGPSQPPPQPQPTPQQRHTPPQTIQNVGTSTPASKPSDEHTGYTDDEFEEYMADFDEFSDGGDPEPSSTQSGGALLTMSAQQQAPPEEVSEQKARGTDIYESGILPDNAVGDGVKASMAKARVDTMNARARRLLKLGYAGDRQGVRLSRERYVHMSAPPQTKMEVLLRKVQVGSLLHAATQCNDDRENKCVGTVAPETAELSMQCPDDRLDPHRGGVVLSRHVARDLVSFIGRMTPFITAVCDENRMRNAVNRTGLSDESKAAQGSVLWGGKNPSPLSGWSQAQGVLAGCQLTLDAEHGLGRQPLCAHAVPERNWLCVGYGLARTTTSKSAAKPKGLAAFFTQGMRASGPQTAEDRATVDWFGRKLQEERKLPTQSSRDKTGAWRDDLSLLVVWDLSGFATQQWGSARVRRGLSSSGIPDRLTPSVLWAGQLPKGLSPRTICSTSDGRLCVATSVGSLVLFSVSRSVPEQVLPDARTRAVDAASGGRHGLIVVRESGAVTHFSPSQALAVSPDNPLPLNVEGDTVLRTRWQSLSNEQVKEAITLGVGCTDGLRLGPVVFPRRSIPTRPQKLPVPRPEALHPLGEASPLWCLRQACCVASPAKCGWMSSELLVGTSYGVVLRVDSAGRSVHPAVYLSDSLKGITGTDADPCLHVCWSPNVPQLFAASFASGTVCVFHCDRSTPLFTWSCPDDGIVLSCTFADSLPGVLWACSSHGRVYGLRFVASQQICVPLGSSKMQPHERWTDASVSACGSVVTVTVSGGPVIALSVAEPWCAQRCDEVTVRNERMNKLVERVVDWCTEKAA